MYLLLTTQGVVSEIGTKYDQYQMTPNKGDIIRRDIKLKKGLDKWREKHNLAPSTDEFNFASALGIAKALSNRYAVGHGHSQVDDMYSVALEGVTKAFTSWNPEKNNHFAGFVSTCIKNSILGELRRVKRWNNEESFAKTQTSEDSIDDSIWTKTQLNQEEQIIAKENLKFALRKVQKLQRMMGERELYVLWNYIIAEEPMTTREIAEQFQCGKSSIHRDVNRIRKQLKIEEN